MSELAMVADESKSRASGGSLLEARGITAGFGTNQVLHGIDLAVRPGEIAGIFGLNGAGKSVTMKVLAGLLPAWSGQVFFEGTDVTSLTPEQRVARGIGNVPQGRQVFPALTVEENLRLGAYTSRRSDRAGYGQNLERVFAQFPILKERRAQMAGTMSGGQQASLAVARALINQPRLILVDEPSAGLAPVIVAELFEILEQVRETGVTMVLVEQNVTFGLRLVDRAHILQVGRIVYEGDVASLDEEQLAGYLGIGRMLGSTASSALASRQSGADPTVSASGRPGPEPQPRAAGTGRERRVLQAERTRRTAAPTAGGTPAKKAAGRKRAAKKGATKTTASKTSAGSKRTSAKSKGSAKTKAAGRSRGADKTASAGKTAREDTDR